MNNPGTSPLAIRCKLDDVYNVFNVLLPCNPFTSIAAGSSLDVEVYCDARSVSEYSGSLLIETNDSAVPQVSYPLSCNSVHTIEDAVFDDGFES